ncbi:MULTISPECIES: protein kinase domain-containing protein [unclassified Microbacterium]|uniref:protein kinase domain-containing protein n=1 Tax=unclassified Microbacterium TaxID=2609290 RepID=UPI00300F82A7
MSRPPSPPPRLAGFTYVEPLGTGGFADVFLYEQELPRRRVAVKVLLADRLASGAAQEFSDEANVMAMLSTHPAIVTIHQAGVAEDGRPYLVMEYCPRPNLQQRARKEPFTVAEALRVGVQVAGAVETAHRAGVLHRDIKPANILVTEYNRPALTDFGIASTTGAVSEASGMSIPWSPPESFADPPTSGVRSDVYALGATVYTLLTGRSPFEKTGERNRGADLIARIEREPLPPLGRPDAPESLRGVLERAMAKDPAQRYPSAVSFARALQKVQIELAHSVTPIDIVDEHPVDDEPENDDDGLTRVRQVVTIAQDGPGGTGATRPSAKTRPVTAEPSAAPGPRFDPGGVPVADDTVIRTPRPVPEDDATVVSPPRVVAPEGTAASSAPSAVVAEPAPTAPDERPRGRRALWIVLAVVAVIALTVGAVVAVNLLNAAPPVPSPSESADVVPQDVISGAVPRVADLSATVAGDQATFTWTNRAPEEGDGYVWNIVTLSGEEELSMTTETTVAVPFSGTQTCIDVMLRRADGRTSEAVRGCTP